jgi:NitT/TauT family transport system permease protein
MVDVTPALETPPIRPEFANERKKLGHIGDVARPLSTWERLSNLAFVRRLAIIIILAVAWELYARWINNPLMVPAFSSVFSALREEVVDGPLIDRTFTTIQVLLIGYGLGILLSAILTTFAVSTRIGNDLLSTLTAMFNPLPAIALLPLALLWFGLGIPSLVFVIVHSVVWAVSLNTHIGFMSVSETQRMAGQNYGLRGIWYVLRLLIPAAFASILAGLKIGWAFAWRTLIAAELVFGVSSRSGGLGWYIFENRNQLLTANVFAGLLMVIIIGLFVESVIFRAIEARTVRRWGMQR